MKFSGEASKSPLSLSLQMDMTVTTQGTTIPLSLAMISVDQKIYIQNTKKPATWYIMSDEQGKDFLGSVGSLGKTKSTLLDVATDSDVTDHGTDTLNGKKLRHLTITVSNDKKELKQAFLKEVGGDFEKLTPEQLDSVTLQNGTADYWIDETTMYIYQQEIHYTAQYHVDGSGAITLGSYNVTKDESTKLTFSKFDVPVTIKAPENAQPLNNILDLLM
jgi:pectate lyase